MCGIAGFCNFQEDFTYDRDKWSKVLVAMREAIAHRGSDQTGEYLDKHTGLSHTRLSIRDLSGGGQPMLRRVAGSDYIIVYNGEVYNTDELTPELNQKGYAFETTSDTEVILYSYIEYGLDFVSRLNGIFAFAIWDGRQNKLILYRDRVGVKPLFYTLENETLVFGSEMKALFRHPQITPRADDDSFREIFGIGPARTAGCGVFKGIRELRPGSFAVFTREGFEEHTYWALKALPHADSYTETVDQVSCLVRDAVTRQMVSDVPVCSFLSGGVDSSIVTAVASKFLQTDGRMLNTFSFDFTNNDQYFQSSEFQPARDRPYVDKMLSAYPLRHTYLECDEAVLAELLPAALYAKDLPGMTDIDASLMYFCSIVKKQNKVALTGECADEIFGGYPWFYREELMNKDGFPWSSDLSARTVLLSDESIAALDLGGYTRQRYEESLKTVPCLAGESAEEKRRREISFLNIRWFMQTLLDRMDRASMSCGLEARVPFADHRIIEYLYNVPWSMKYQNGVEKALLRDACGDLLPQELLFRKKSPYPKTYDPRYEMLLTQRFRQVLDNRDAPVNRFVDRYKAERFLSAPKDYGKPWFGQLMAAPQMIAYLLQVNDWMVRYNVG
ncbi:Asparagine synthetase (glutamine-hydrolyzing) 3 [uncultured Eubacteriales bacterium]|uniref:asparagine synthase (glutamine-hydrolyzing) n=1 Tax=uncultured Eubacteriales bacterium TaxID=172733 RepID=A0A212K3V3_9FIRM|nr:Asparagine synthetase (glutamine-hydrolyzing) 3 [uncultured Eubacteriales bacterium]